MAKRLTVVISQAQGKNPAKRQIEEDIVTGLLMDAGIDVTIVPNLYDIHPDSSGMLALQQINGNMVVLSWLYQRAAHWVLDRSGIHGHVGTILLDNDDEEEEDDSEDETAEAESKERVIETRDIPNRQIYCLDLRATTKADAFIEEVRRIHGETNVQVVSLGNGSSLSGGNGNSTAAPTPETPPLNGGAPANDAADVVTLNDVVAGLSQPSPGATNGVSSNGVSSNGGVTDLMADRFANPVNDTSLAPNGQGLENGKTPQRFENEGGRRWYPVIDFSRCTNCMECIDFCLFGVYGVDQVDTILVEQPDNCRKGCPACSRVCPENAIMFPQHKTPAIAGSMDAAENMKIDLSQLFGAPADGKSAEELAAIERDEQLMLAGRDAVGIGGGKAANDEAPHDDLDDLVDALNELDI